MLWTVIRERQLHLNGGFTMSFSKKMKYTSALLLAIGFLIPLFASNYVGMSLYAKPWVSASTIILWAVGLICGYLGYVSLKKIEPSVPLWIRISNYISSDSSKWLLLGVLFGYLYYPTMEKSVIAANMTTFLMISLFVMGLNISLPDWKRIMAAPKVVLICVLIRWSVMPLVAVIVGKLVFGLFLPAQTANTLIIGLVLLGTTPTGTASNTLTLISRGDLALSVSVTTVNTIIAPFLQPLLLLWLVGGLAKVNTGAMFMDLIKIVIIPVIIGTILGIIFPNVIKKIMPILAPIAILCLGLVMLSSMSKGTSTLIKQLYILPFLIIANVLHGLTGLTLGFFLPRYFGFNEQQRRAACFEVGVENAALTASMALAHFNPLTALPGILYGKIQNILAITIFVPLFQKHDEKLEQERKAASNQESIPL